jgi:TPR repeat protein
MKEMDTGHSDEIDAGRRHAYSLLLAKDYRGAKQLFEQLFDGTDPSIATYLGTIHSQKNTSEYNRDLSVAYYKIAAAAGNEYSQHALGGMLLEDGLEEEAIKWYKCASAQGNAECSYNLAGLFKRRGEDESAERFFRLAVQQGHPLAIQNLAVRSIVGRYGIRQVIPGFWLYLKNLPNLARYAKAHAASHSSLGNLSRSKVN